MLIRTFLDFLRAHGCRAVYGQMVVHSGRRAGSLFKRYGFRVMDRVEVTKVPLDAPRACASLHCDQGPEGRGREPSAGAYLKQWLRTNRAATSAPGRRADRAGPREEVVRSRGVQTNTWCAGRAHSIGRMTPSKAWQWSQ